MRGDDLHLLRSGQRVELRLVVGDLRFQVGLLRGDLVVRLLRLRGAASASVCATAAASAAAETFARTSLVVARDGASSVPSWETKSSAELLVRSTSIWLSPSLV